MFSVWGKSEKTTCRKRVTMMQVMTLTLSWWCHGRCHGMAKVWGRMDAGDTGEGKHAGERTQKHTQHTQTHTIYAGSGPSCEGNTPTPACLSLIPGYLRLQRAP